MSKSSVILVKALLCFSILLPSQALAGSFLIYNQDAKANGMGLAVVSSIDNPSAIFYNPALLPSQPGLGISMGDTIFMSERRFEDSVTGVRTQAKKTTHHVPSFFTNYTKGPLALGVGVYSPFGLSSEWPQNWTGRYTSTFGEIKTVFINPTIAYKLNEWFSVGAGLSYVDSSLKLKQAMNLFPFPDGIAKLSGNGDGFGYNAGVNIRLPLDYALSFAYRSPVEIKYNGRARFYTDSPFKPFLPDGNVTTKMTLPYIFMAGLSKQIGKLTVETDFIYTGWSAVKEYTVKYDNGMPSQTFRKDWRDSPSIAIGANYRWNNFLETRLGYMYDWTPVPTRTLTPDLPDSSKHVITGGLGFNKGSFKMDIAYQATAYERADSRNNIVGAPRGIYNGFAHVVLVNLMYMMK
jgi:long-chain fatty acid transport protein